MKKFDIFEVLRVLWRKIWIIGLAFIVCAVAGFSYSAFYATERFSTQSAILVTTGNNIITKPEDDTSSKTSISNGEIITTMNMLQTYGYSLRMLKFYERVAALINGRTSVEYSAKQLKGMTTVSYAESAFLIKFQVAGTVPEDIKIIAQVIADESPEHLANYFPGTVAIVSEDALDVAMTYPNDTLFTMGGGMIGAVLAAAIIYIIAVRDNTLKTEDDIVSGGFASLGFVPDFNESRGGGYYSEYRY